MVSHTTGVHLHDINNSFKAYRREVIEDTHLKLYGEFHRFVPVMAHWRGYRVTEIKVKHHPRTYAHPYLVATSVDVGNECREAPGDHRHPSMALAWWIGAMAGRVSEWRLDGQLRCSVNTCAQPWLAPHVAGASLS
jgi:hypothetical protein